jgi:tRNA threonylcarbamoyladenosine biosynthesis protein TsaB
MMLALDTATEACSVALWVDGTVLERAALPGRGHAELLLPMAHALLAEAGAGLGALDAIAFGRGPGAFTGVRIAASAAQALAFGLDRPVVPVSDLRALAQGTMRLHGAVRVLACLDARMAEVYVGAFLAVDGIARVLAEERLLPPAAVVLPEAGDWHAAGHGFRADPGLAARLRIDPSRVAAELLPLAGDVARIAAAEFAAGGALDPALALPVYLRDDVAHRSRAAEVPPAASMKVP